MSDRQATFLIIGEWLLNLKMPLSHDSVVPVSCHTAPTLIQMSFRGTPVLSSQGRGSSLGSCWRTRTLCISILVTPRILMLPNDTLRPLKSGLCWLIPIHNRRGLGEEWLGEGGHTKGLSEIVLHLKKGFLMESSVGPGQLNPALPTGRQSTHQWFICWPPSHSVTPFPGTTSVSCSRACPQSLAWCLQLWSPIITHSPASPAVAQVRPL